MPLLQTHLTKTDFALSVLRDRIRSGELKPGQRLRVEEVSAELGMSPTPVREALRVLQADRLVDYRAHHPIIVTAVSTGEIDEIYGLRAVLEPMATGLAVPKLTNEQLADLESLHRDFSSACDVSNTTLMTELNRSWHWALYDASESKYLVDFLRRLWESFPWRTIATLPWRAQQRVDEHLSVMEAIRDRNAAAASERMRLHIEQAGTEFRASLGLTVAEESVPRHSLPWPMAHTTSTDDGDVVS